MDLNYSILWFEDNDSWYQGAYEGLEILLDDFGFKLEIRREKNDANLNSIKNFSKFDLIAVDLKLDGVRGNKIIEFFRNQRVFTEVVFYSADGLPALRKTVNEDGGLDGVYCVDRDSFEDRILSIIKVTIKKVLDINTMRGITMAAVSEFDSVFDDCLLKHLEKVDKAYKDNVKNGFISHVVGHAKRNLSRIEKLTCEIPDSELISHKSLTSATKFQLLSKVVSEHECSDVSIHAGNLKQYQEEILNKRNILAHIVETEDEHGNAILRRKDNGQLLTETDLAEVRKNLIKYRAIFSDISKSIYK